MQRRIGVSAAIAAICPGILLGIFEVMGWKMPSQLAVALAILTGVAGFVALAVMLHGIWVWLKPLRSRYGLRTPIYKRRPDPHQWLIDIAEKQRQGPTSHLVITDAICFALRQDLKRPELWLRVYGRNLGAHRLLIGHPEGAPFFGEERLPERLAGC